MCIAMVAGCAEHEPCGAEVCEDDGSVGAYGTTEGGISSSSILSINGKYGASCTLHANQSWSIAMLQGAPLDYPMLEVAKKNSACVLSLVSLRTGSGASNMYTAANPVVLAASYGASALFTSPASSLAANARLSALDFQSTFALTLLVSQDVQTSGAGTTTYYAYDACVFADAPLSYWRLDDSVPLPFASDSFLGSAGTALQSRVGASLSWTKHSASGTNAVLSNAGRVRTAANKTAVYLAAAAASSADYAVSADVFVASLLPNDQAGVIGRASSAANTCYFAGLVETYTLSLIQFRRFELWKFIGGIGIQLGYYEDSSMAGSSHRVSLEMIGTSIRASLDGTQRIVATDSSITATGAAGLLLGANNGSTQTEAAGLHLDNLSVRNPALARDSAGTNHGFYANDVTRGASGALAVPNASASFDGIDDFVEVTRQIGNDFSIELWFKSTQGLGAASVTQWHDTAGLVDAYAALSNGDFGIGLRSDGKLLVGTGKTSCLVPLLCGEDDETLISSGSTAYNDGAWHHVVFTRSKALGAMALYVDSVSKAALASGGSIHTLDAVSSMSIGRLQTGSNYFAGNIDEVAVYTTVLSAQSVLNHYRAGKH